MRMSANCLGVVVACFLALASAVSSGGYRKPLSEGLPASHINVSFEGGNADLSVTRWVGNNTLQYQGARKCGPASTKCSPYTNWAYFAVSNLSTTEPTTLHTLSGNWLSDP